MPALVRVDANVDNHPNRIGSAASRMESLGYDGVRVAETDREPFIPLAMAAAHTNDVELVTSVVVAFARNPVLLAMQAHELNLLSGGRLVLGIGSQVRPHIERRFGMPWHGAARQMREFIGALKAVFRCWHFGERLNFEGEFYRHTLMPRTFTPKETSVGIPPILLSATGPLMTQVAADLADGLIAHPFSSARYLTEVTVPTLEQRLRKSNRSLEEFLIDYAPMVAIGDNEQQLAKSTAQLRNRIAFYGRTVAYRPVLALHGWEALQDELIRLNQAHRQAEMASLINDEMLETIGIVGSFEQVIEQMRHRFGGIISRTCLNVSGVDSERLRHGLQQLRTPLSTTSSLRAP